MAICQLNLYNQKKRTNLHYVLQDYKEIIQIDCEDNGKFFYLNKSGEKIATSCYRCFEPKCMHYSKEELSFSTIDIFPSELESSVCPSMAISWSLEEKTPKIDSNLCISCGLCIQRCNFGAISFNENFIAEISSIENTKFEELPYTNEESENILNYFKNIPKEKPIKQISSGHLLIVYSKINEINSKLSLQFPNLISRNLLISLGLNSVIRRRGDVNIRMDLLVSNNCDIIGVSEVEFGNDILNSPRNILDNIAVLHSRYKVKKENLIPIIISFSLPNKRSEYWNVISDIKKVTNLNITSITIGALLMILWSNKKITMKILESFYADENSYSIRNYIESIIGKEFELKYGELSILEANK